MRSEYAACYAGSSVTADSQFDWAGVIFGLCVAAIGFGAAYWAWPTGITDVPLSGLTLRQVLWLLGSLALGFVGVVGVFWAIKDANEPFR
jgi:hypothetical protein